MKPIKFLFSFFIFFICAFEISQAQVGFGTTTPETSAMLEVKSTSKGFLPPRLTYAQRQTITNPVAGLTIWCSNCGTSGEAQVYNGTTWTNMVGGNASGSIGIGDNYGGGKVAYILQSGDPGYVAGQTHGLIAAASDQSTGIQWYNGSFTTTGAIGTSIGSGLANTTTIINSQGNTGSYAGKICRDYTGGGYTDWYLPSKDELNKLYINKNAIGGFTNFNYWSSTESDYYGAWYQGLVNGSQSSSLKYVANYVRAVRFF
jgi:hypothetical protein